ncbi:transcriptional regulator, Rrf2 family [Pseudoroseomonas cervicalis ATCC 49957]|uniref:Transcriptional regulator, Rrf2 family n=2 Tax=Teichococcus cervicalis TaxID=204525 RepID=D5RQD6_9PROT|nr:transcriptional regulator, Rrf2 family [Pseudoroseomonas cervicalis ATCC 49957]
MALVELAARERDRQNANDCHAQGAVTRERPVSLAEIAQAQLLSVAYLEQLFARLRRAGLVDSARGPGGGYRLARPAEAIAIGTIIEAVDEPISATRCEEGSPGCLAGNRCLTHDLWHELGEQIRLFLENVTLADVVEQRVCGRAIIPAPPP